MIFPILTANDGSIDPFMFRLSFAARSSMSYLAIWHYLLAMHFDDGRSEADFNYLENKAAARFYCEYRTRERIHRSVADLRLLAIPAS